MRERIFEPFYTTKAGRPGAGMGVGLAVCKDIVESLRGRLDFETEEGEGTRFTVRVPMAG
ncbi:MAG: hypothetical protein COZ56_05805 [Armatimonadetes bacterium CG_4_8_14_3_um_filter_58_9]|nr:MAG: hypothetical protein COZ56_05805 [Armatimonadetes bacterium CG_4_8_14_3_um_filter_58_9]